MKSKTIIISLSIIILLLISALIYFVAIPKYNDSIYNKAYNLGYNNGVYDEILRINQLGVIPVIQYNNATGNSTINEISINNICNGNSN